MLPRVLVLYNFPFNQLDGGGIGISNYFSNWPQDRLAQLYGPLADLPAPLRDAADHSICKKYFVLSHKEIRRPFLIKTAYRLLRQNASEGPATESQELAPSDDRSSIRRRLEPLKRFARMGGLSAATNAVITPELDAFLSDFKPDIVHTGLGNLAFIRLAKAIRQRYGTALSIHLHDDWMQDAFPHGPYAAIRQWQLNHELTALLRSADIRFAICDMMREALGKRYGVPFENLQSPVHTEEWFLPRSTDSSAQKHREIVYCGTIMENAQLRSLVDVAKVVERLNRTGLEVRLTIATPPGLGDEFEPQFPGDSTRFVSYRGKEDMLKIFSRADLLLIPVNFDSASRRFIRYSMPGKHVVYMASGVPTFVYGPDDVPPTVESRKFDYAFVHTSQNLTALEASLHQALTDDNERNRLKHNALKHVRENHEFSHVIDTFRAKLGAFTGEH